VVWHHRRNSVRAYWKQQCGYGEAEALLERKWPEKYNAAGHVHWSGRVYGPDRLRRIQGRGERIYHGMWGSAPFQALYQPAPRVVWSLPALPDWYLFVAALAALSGVGLLWAPLLYLLPAFGLGVALSLVHAWLNSASASSDNFRLRALTAFLSFLQPPARLWGRLRGGLLPWRRYGSRGSLPRRRSAAVWSERWRSQEDRLRAVESSLRGGGILVLRGGAHDRWDLDVRSGTLGSARLIMGVEDHALGKQLVRFRWWPRCSWAGLGPAVVFAAIGAGAALDGAWPAFAVLAAVPVALALRALQECSTATGAVARAIESET